MHGWPGLRADDLRDLARRVVARGEQDAATHRVADEIHEVADHLASRGLGEGTETSDWSVARQRFVDEAVTLARGRWGSSILDESGTKRRWWRRWALAAGYVTRSARPGR